MSDLGPSVSDIAQARNQKLQHEAELRGQQVEKEVEAVNTAQDVTGELLSAHLAAQHIKSMLPDPIESTPAFPAGSTAHQAPTAPGQGPSLATKVQAGAADLYHQAKDSAAAAGDTIKDILATSDQSRASSQQGPSITQKVQAGAADLSSRAQHAAAAAGQTIKETVVPSHITTTSSAAGHGPTITEKVQAGAADLSAGAQHAAAAIKETVVPSHTSTTTTTTTTTTSSAGHGPTITEKVQAGAADLSARAQHAAASAGQAIKETVAPSHTSSSTSTSSTPSTAGHGPTITEKVQAGAAGLYTRAIDTAAATVEAIKHTVTPADATTTSSTTTTSHQQGPSIAQKVQAGAADLSAKAQHAAAATADAIKHTVTPADTTTTSTTTSTHQGPTITQKVQAAQAQLYSKAANTASAAGEAIKGTIASADQATTSKLRDAAAASRQAVSGTADGGVGLAAQAGGLLGSVKEAVKGALGLGAEAEGSPATAYEGAVFSSDDPEYREAASSGRAGHSTTEQLAAAPANQGSKTESRTPPLTLDEIKASPALAGAPAGADAHTTSDITTGTTSTTGTGTTKDSGLLDKPRQPVIFSPKEPAGGGSLGEGSVGVAAGDPAGGANIVAAAKTAGKGILDSLGFGGTAGAPAGPPPDIPDPRTAGVAVGDMKGLKEALAASRDTAATPAAGSSSSSGRGDAVMAAEAMDTASNSAGSTDAAAGADPAALQQGYEQMDSAQQSYESVKDSAQQKLDAAAQAASEAVGGSAASGGTAAAGGAGGGFLSGLASIVTDIATKVNLASSSEELMAGGLVPDEAPGPAAAGGATAQQPAPEAAAAADAAADKVAAAKDAVGGSGRSVGEAASDAAAAAKEKAADVGEAASDAATAAKDKASDMAASAQAAVSDAAAAAKEKVSDAAAATKDVAASAQDKTSDAAAAAKDKVSDAAAATKDAASGAAASAQDTAGDAAAATQESAGGAAERVQVAQHVALSQAVAGSPAYPDMCLHPASSSSGSKDAAAQAGAGATDSGAGSGSGSLVSSLRLNVDDVRQQQQQAMAVYATAGRDTAVVGSRQAAADGEQAAAGSSSSGSTTGGPAAGSPRVGGMAAAVRAAGGSLVQGAKEGLVGAYDAAAGAAASAADTIKHTAEQVTGGTSSGSGSTSSSQQADEMRGGGFGHGSGSSSSPSGGGYAGGEGSSLSQAWEDLKHGGSKAPRAVANAGETAAPHDVTSNVERSKHLADPQQAKIYDAEVYRVSPGSQVHPLSDQEQARAASGAVAGAKHQVTGAVPHDKPDTSRVTPDQPNRFAGDKGINTGFGTGSAAPWGGDAVKRATQHFVHSSSSGAAGGLPSADVAEAAPAGQGTVRGWVSCVVSAWSNMGRAAAVGPTGKDVPKDFDNPTQDVMIDPVRGAVKMQGESPGHKVMMRPADQVPTGGTSRDPHMMADKVERLGKAVKDSLTTSSEEAAADPNNLKGKSSDNRPDGTEYFLKHEAAEAVEGLKEAPGKVAGALGTAAEIGGGVLQHLGEKVGDAAQLLAHPGAHTAGTRARQERAEAGVARVAAGGSIPGDGPSEGAPRIHSMRVGAGGAGDMQALEEQRLAAIESPAGKRETLGDKVIGPLVSDMGDESKAKELAASYKEYKAEQAAGGSDSGPSPGSSPAAMSSSAQPSGTMSAAAAEANAASGSAAAATGEARAPHHHTHFWQRHHHKDAASLADEAKDAAQGAVDSTAEAAGRATGKVENAAEAVGDKVEGAARSVGDAARDTAREVRDTAAAAGGVAKMELQAGVDSAAHGAGRAAGTVSRNVEEAKQQTAAAGEAAGNAAGGLLSSVGGAAKSLLGGLLGPFEREAAFEESSAVAAGTPPKPEPVGVEQLSGAEAARLDASRAAGRDTTEHSGRSIGDAAAAKVQQARGAAPPAGDAVDVSRLQAGIDDAAKAAGLAVGHLESSAEAVAQKVAAAQDAVKEQLAAAADNFEVPPAEIPSNTEELIRQRQLQA
ncbi:hypothetical protein OEZ85_001998 [Tetradesmus obliquus]|uniref:Methyl-accepting transducer domain-containing protein n=1 Tax=Tetradesmus obliquus TaxID=3088 RepID=A0ABY8U4D1_TETOB|nr:hypothetical protein OEZ85_001998 [Tetradesmus obliquus]